MHPRSGSLPPWETVARTRVLDDGPYLVVEHHTVRLPDGRVLEPWAWLDMPDYVNVAVVTDEEKFLVFRQTKYAAQGETLAPVGGYREPGEAPLAAAQRELREETGFTADRWTDLGTYAVDGNRGAGHAHLFLATGARKTHEREADDLEEQELLFLAESELRDALTTGAFKVLPWGALFALALLRLHHTP
jgi:ADP-ribose pyrophosphatase